MSPKISITRLMIALWGHINVERRRQLSLTLALMIFSSLTEVVSIGAVLPLLSILASKQNLNSNTLVARLTDFFKINDSSNLLIFLVLIFIFAAVLAGLTRLILLWYSTRISFAIGADFSNEIYRRTLLQPYSIHLQRNSSQLIDGISVKANNIIYNVVVPATFFVGSTIMFLVISVGLLYLSPMISLLTIFGFGVIYSAIIYRVKNKVKENSVVISRDSSRVIKVLQEGLGGIRDILIDNSQKEYCKSFYLVDQSLRKAQASSQFISQSPRYLVESLGMILVALLAYFLTVYGDGFGEAIAMLGVLVLGIQRMLPVLQQGYWAWATMQGSAATLQESLTLLSQPVNIDVSEDAESIDFVNSIELNGIGYRYENKASWVIRNINLEVGKGECIGFIGKTGSGKSTLLDLVMNLLQPTEGSISIDGKLLQKVNSKGWQKHIAHVPQSIYLKDASILENIAFGVPDGLIDLDRVMRAAKFSHLSTVIENLPEGYHTTVGERGVQLSGGQRQRIGIARALYKEADVLIFDEATSALDAETESEVMKSISALNKDLTVFIIAHRLSTLKNCTKIVELADGEICRVGTYTDIVEKNIKPTYKRKIENEE